MVDQSVDELAALLVVPMAEKLVDLMVDSWAVTKVADSVSL